jgi:hypothetical protein
MRYVTLDLMTTFPKRDIIRGQLQVGPRVNEIAPSFRSRVLLDIAHSQQDSSLGLQMVHVAVGELLLERELEEPELDEEMSDAECPSVRLSMPLFR